MFIGEEGVFDPVEVLELYDSVGWEGYTSDVDKLCRGLVNSHLVITARDGSGSLLGLARPLAADRRRPWERPAPFERLTPARVRRDFRHIRPTASCPAGAPKPSCPGPGRPPGRKNTRPTPRHDVHTVHKTDTAASRNKKSTTPRPRRTG